MNSLTFTIEAQGRSRQVSEAGLAILLGLNPDDIRRRVTWYLGHGSSPWGPNSPTTQPEPAAPSPGEGGKGGMGNVSEHVGPHVNHVNENINPNVTESERERTARAESERTERGDESVAACGFSPESPNAASEALAAELADALADRISLACYRRLTREHSHDLLRRALDLALEVPPEVLHRRRGAYFMGIVRKLAKNASNS